MNTVSQHRDVCAAKPHTPVTLATNMTGRLVQGGSNMTGTDLCVKQAALRSSCATLRE